jgi:hypothetical protein
MKIEDYQYKLIKEANKLSKKKNKLANFINSELFKKLDFED